MPAAKMSTNQTPIQATIQAAIQANDTAAVIAAVPYAQKLGMQAQWQDGELHFSLPYRPALLGNAIIGALHGGAVAGFMENAALLYLMLGLEQKPLPKSINFSIEYLRSARQEPVYASCNTVRLGRRVALIDVTAWQSSKDKPVTQARCHFLLK